MKLVKIALLAMVLFSNFGCALEQVVVNKDNIVTLKTAVDTHLEDHGEGPTDPLKETENRGGFLGKIFTLGSRIPGEIGMVSALLAALFVAKSGEED